MPYSEKVDEDDQMDTESSIAFYLFDSWPHVGTLTASEYILGIINETFGPSGYDGQEDAQETIFEYLDSRRYDLGEDGCTEAGRELLYKAMWQLFPGYMLPDITETDDEGED